jgi:hypothetical protein
VDFDLGSSPSRFEPIYCGVLQVKNTYNAVFFLSIDIFIEYYAGNNRITGPKKESISQ